jgi:acyl-CoA synthetase (NDP forming)
MTAMLEYKVMDLLESYSIHCPDHRFSRTALEVRQAAGELGYPLVMKIVSPDILHKSDVGGVRIGLKDLGDIQRAYDQILRNVTEKCPEAHLEGVLLTRQVPDGMEVIIGLTQDATFGPVLMFGLGGIFVEVLKDVTFRAIPIQKLDAYQMIHGIKNHVVLSGWRGQKPVDIDILGELLLKVSKLACDHPEIKEMDLNPVRVVDTDLWVLDGKAIICE